MKNLFSLFPVPVVKARFRLAVLGVFGIAFAGAALIFLLHFLVSAPAAASEETELAVDRAEPYATPAQSDPPKAFIQAKAPQTPNSSGPAELVGPARQEPVAIADETNRETEAQKTEATRQAALAVARSRSNINCAVLKCLALTFDDGPDPAVTPRVLDALQSRGVVATFFEIGSRVKANPDLTRRAASLGNEIGNHTWDHTQLTTLKVAAIKTEIQSTQEIIKQTIGVYPRLFRPPYGSTNATVAANVGLPQIRWSYDTLDWMYKNANTVFVRGSSGAKPGGIILMHDVHPTTADAVGRLVDHLTSQGYTLVTVSELLNLDKEPKNAPPGKVITHRG
jgi:peptidoglycan/xylan/chitin deacetylase (PgdA/CDA1 family)